MMDVDFMMSQEMWNWLKEPEEIEQLLQQIR